MADESNVDSVNNDPDSVGIENNENENDKLGEGGEKKLRIAIEREKRIKEEARKLQEERDALLKEKEELQLKTLEETGKVKELNDLLKQKAIESEKKLNEYVARSEVEKISNKLKDYASREGANVPEDIVTIFMPQLRDKKFSEVNEDMLKDLISEAKQSRPFWFKRDASINDLPPRNQPPAGKKDVSQMSIEELKAEYAKKKLNN